MAGKEFQQFRRRTGILSDEPATAVGLGRLALRLGGRLMSTVPLAGRWICLGVLAFLALQPVAFLVATSARANAGSREFWSGLSAVGATVIAAANLAHWLF